MWFGCFVQYLYGVEKKKPQRTHTIQCLETKMCAGALSWSQIGKIVYGASDEKRGFSRLTENILHPRTKIVSGVMAEESSQIVKDFFAKKR